MNPDPGPKRPSRDDEVLARALDVRNEVERFCATYDVVAGDYLPIGTLGPYVERLRAVVANYDAARKPR